MSERIELFFNDQVDLLKSNNAQKIKSEILKLTKYLHKHQNEIIDSNTQTKLLMIVEKYVKYGSATSVLKDAIAELVGLLLSLPEGKLVTSKSKKKVLIWYDSLCTEDSQPQELDGKPEKFTVIDINADERTLVLLSEADSDHFVENVKTDSSSLFDEIAAKFENSEESIVVEVCNSIVVTIQS
jgi:hypothetical protein